MPGFLGYPGTGRGGRGTEEGFINTGIGISDKILVCEAGGRALWVLDKGPGFGKTVCAVGVGVMVLCASSFRSAVWLASGFSGRLFSGIKLLLSFCGSVMEESCSDLVRDSACGRNKMCL